jgi:hypothetical protein
VAALSRRGVALLAGGLAAAHLIFRAAAVVLLVDLEVPEPLLAHSLY